MNQYVTGAVIKELREKNGMTQLQLADKLGVSDRTVSKWETAKGYPDITLLEPIADAFYCNRDGLYFVEPVKSFDKSKIDI